MSGEQNFVELPIEAKIDYLKGVSTSSRTAFQEYREGYFHLGWPRYHFGDLPKAVQLMQAVVYEDKNDLTQSEITQIYEYDRNNFKIHLNVSPEKRIEVYKKLNEVCTTDAEIDGKFPKDRKANGERLSSLLTWKMKDPSLPNNVSADFVFYARGIKGYTQEEALNLLVNELSDVLSEVDYQPHDELVRFSTPVSIDGRQIPGMSYTQGNGDFKGYLAKNYGWVELAKYYDPSTHYATRTGGAINFHSL